MKKNLQAVPKEQPNDLTGQQKALKEIRDSLRTKLFPNILYEGLFESRCVEDLAFDEPTEKLQTELDHIVEEIAELAQNSSIPQELRNKLRQIHRRLDDAITNFGGSAARAMFDLVVRFFLKLMFPSLSVLLTRKN